MKNRTFATGKETITESSFERPTNGAKVELPRLLLVMSHERPLLPGLRVALVGLDEVRLARGQRRVERIGRRATLFVEDARISRCHAVVRRVAAGWELVDASSKNGTTLNGDRCVRAVLIDGDVVEVGGTTFMFRDGEHPVASGVPADRDLADPAEVATPPAFRTLAVELERRLGELRRIAASPVCVLATGESGTGKELVARAIHDI